MDRMKDIKIMCRKYRLEKWFGKLRRWQVNVKWVFRRENMRISGPWK